MYVCMDDCVMYLPPRPRLDDKMMTRAAKNTFIVFLSVDISLLWFGVN